jgi:hypothetical protein
MRDSLSARSFHDDDALGRFVLQEAPDGTWCWTLDSFVLENKLMTVNVMTVTAFFPDTIRMLFVRNILKNAKSFIFEATKFLRSSLEQDSSLFKMSDEQAREVLALSIVEFPIENPQFVFHTDGTWSIYFDADRLAIWPMVSFEQADPVSMEDLYDGEAL